MRGKTSAAQGDALRYAVNLIGAAAALYCGALALLRLASGWFVSAFRGGATLSDPTGVPEVAVGMVNFLMAAGALWAVLSFLRGMAPKARRPALHFTDPRDVRLWLFLPVFIGMGLLSSMLTAGFRLLLTAHTAYIMPQSVTLPDNALALLLDFLAMCVVPAVGEELLCRGWMQGLLRRWGVWFSIVVSSAVFALLHGDLAQMPGAFVLSVFLGLAAYTTDSLLPGIVLHFCNNTVAFLLLWAEQKIAGIAALGVFAYLLVILGLLAAL